MKKIHYILICFAIVAVCTLAWLGTIASPDMLDPAPRPHLIELMLFDAQKSTVRVSVEYEGTFKHVGSGFVATSDGYIITARHVADMPAPYRVTWQNGIYADATVVFVSTFTDCAVLKIDGVGLDCLPLRATRPHLGETVYVIGNPVGELFENYVTRGIVAKLRVALPALNLTDLFMIDAAVNVGNSGGPILDEHGYVIGIAIAKMPYADGMGFAVCAEDIADTLQKARNEKRTRSSSASAVEVAAVGS